MTNEGRRLQPLGGGKIRPPLVLVLLHALLLGVGKQNFRHGPADSA